jgi:hypothetical protein
MSLLFVTVICDLYRDRDYSTVPQTNAWSESWLTINFRLTQLKRLIDANIPLLIFAEDNIIPDDWTIPESTKIISFSFDNIETYQKILKCSPQLPTYINTVKDTLEYFALMNSKVEFISLAQELFPNYEIYCWIDSGIFKMIRDISTAYSNLTNMQNLCLDRPFLSPAGDLTGLTVVSLTDDIWWRFLGSIFFLKCEYINVFKNECDKILDSLLAIDKIVWEVNIWTMLEYDKSKLFSTYPADHNDSILDIKMEGSKCH